MCGAQEELPRLAEVENILAIFCMATYGEGDPTDNAQEFNEWLHDTESKLDGVKYAVSRNTLLMAMSTIYISCS